MIAGLKKDLIWSLFASCLLLKHGLELYEEPLQGLANAVLK